MRSHGAPPDFPDELAMTGLPHHKIASPPSI